VLVEERLGIGGLNIALRYMSPPQFQVIPEPWIESFRPQSSINFVVSAYFGSPWARRPLPPPVFASGGTWSARKQGPRIHFVLRARQDRQYARFWVDPVRRVAGVHLALPNRRGAPPVMAPHPFTFPTLHLLVMAALSSGRGIILHGCGLIDRGRGLVFTGSSGAGKSTMARLWEGQGVFLNDERVILTKPDGHYIVHGTPWHGEMDRYSSAGGPLSAVFLLKQAEKNEVRSLSEASAVREISRHALLPYWDREDLDASLGFLAGLVAKVPCRELRFRKEPGVVDFVRCAISP